MMKLVMLEFHDFKNVLLIYDISDLLKNARNWPIKPQIRHRLMDRHQLKSIEHWTRIYTVRLHVFGDFTRWSASAILNWL